MVDLRGDLVVRRAAEDGEPALDTSAQRERVQLVHLVTAGCCRVLLGDRAALPVPSVVHVRAPVVAADDSFDGDPLPLEECADHETALPAQKCAQRDVHTEQSQHPGLPHALASRVEVDVIARGVALDRDGEAGGGGEDGRRVHRRCPQAVWPACVPSPISSTSLSLNAGRSSGVRLETRPWSTTTSSSPQCAPAFRRSVCRLG